jgi:hypothetical protein
LEHFDALQRKEENKPYLNAKRPKKKPGEDYYTSRHHKLEGLPAEDHGWLSLQTGAAAVAGYLMSAISIFRKCFRAAERSQGFPQKVARW